MKHHVLTKYECARILGIRVAQLNMNAPVQVKVPSNLSGNLMYIATKELLDGKLDIIIKRPLPHNTFYNVHISDLQIPDDLVRLEEMLNG